ncbi:MAG: Single-stranded DNA-binding replication protein A (RPA), large subunit [Candidatus Methanohalarchaeum thermophilum]|uniref:Single-stranded DNA-binding replication protein A (RPA), large subunit n=1 Tax=Methanohalarchaeum thermophilum TaxID=1903181 RepID=A0A1Q6DUG1_METT1|nr:MAG: Single-stranded DNA-binding replication protein A (RPA), large subunit [Candidatus Methanohalarchaeum thermophilum]
MDKVEKALKEVKESIEGFDQDSVRNELEELIKNFNVPIDQAVSTVIRKHRDDSTRTKGKKNISEIEVDESGLEIEGRVIRKTSREIEVEGEKREVISGTIADESGKIGFTSWTAFPFEEGAVVLIENGYTREWRGNPELQIGDYTNLKEGDDEAVPDIKELKSPKEVTLPEVGNVFKAKIEAEIVDVQNGSGLIMRCPECNRVTKGGECQVHGEVDPNPDLRIKAILDDGRGVTQATLGREVTEKLTNIKLEEAKKMARDALDKSVVKEEMKKVVGKTIIAIGQAIGDNFVVREVSEPSWAPEEKAKNLLEELKEV